jgi:endonuclease/exonuclease/phosphatase family metal-dependent hydrolase
MHLKFTLLLKICCIALGGVLLLLAALLIFLTVTEYKPASVEPIAVSSMATKTLSDETLRILTLNVGYGGLDASSDFFMDGGKSVFPQTKELVQDNLEGIAKVLKKSDADIFFLQEVDLDAKRSFGINESQFFSSTLEYDSAFALNYSCAFVPYPLPPLGKLYSGLLTLSRFQLESASRISLPVPFSWPVSTANLKRCLLVSVLDLPETDAQCILVNLHLEAYDDGEGKSTQMKTLLEFIESEYEKGNYVIAGGDFNQIFPGTESIFPMVHTEVWEPGILEIDILPEGWQYAYDTSAPTCRLLNQPYDPESANTQHYVLDGYILSPNVELLSVETLDMKFTNTDHNPVALEVRLLP